MKKLEIMIIIIKKQSMKTDFLYHLPLELSEKNLQQLLQNKDVEGLKAKYGPNEWKDTGSWQRNVNYKKEWNGSFGTRR